MHQSALLKNKNQKLRQEKMAINTRHEDNFNFLFKRKYDIFARRFLSYREFKVSPRI